MRCPSFCIAYYSSVISLVCWVTMVTSMPSILNGVRILMKIRPRRRSPPSPVRSMSLSCRSPSFIFLHITRSTQYHPSYFVDNARFFWSFFPLLSLREGVDGCSRFTRFPGLYLVTQDQCIVFRNAEDHGNAMIMALHCWKTMHWCRYRVETQGPGKTA